MLAIFVEENHNNSTMTPTIPNLTILDLLQFNFRDSLEDFEVDCLQSLNNLLFGGLQEFYKQDGCILNKERYFLSMFNTAYYISSMAIKGKRPSLLRAEYEHMASKAPSDIEILPPGDPWRKYNIMTMVCYILAFFFRETAPSLDLRRLCRDISDISLAQHKRFYDILDLRLKWIISQKKARQLCIPGLQSQETSKGKMKTELESQIKEQKSNENLIDEIVITPTSKIEEQEKIVHDKNGGIARLESERSVIDNNIDDEECNTERLDTAQLIMLFETLLNVPLGATYTNIHALSKLIAKVSGYKASAVRTKINQGRDYDNAKSKKDAAMLVELLKPIDKNNELLAVSRLKENFGL